MLKVKPKLPQIDPNNNSQGNKGVAGDSAKNVRSLIKGKTPKSHKQHQLGKNANKGLSSANLKVQTRGKVNSNNGLQLGKSVQLNFSANTNVSLNANGRGFSLGLNQNLQTAVTLLFQVSSPSVQSALQGFSGQELVSTLFLNAGIFSEVQGNLGHKGQNPILDNPILRQVFTILSINDPTNNQSSQAFDQIRSLWHNTGGIFSDCGCTKTVKDIQIIAQTYANALEKGDVDTIVKLTEILQKAQDKTENRSYKLSNMLTQFVSRGEKIAVKNAQVANLDFLKNTQTAAAKDIKPQVQIKTETSANTNALIGAKEQIFVTDKTNHSKSDFYTEKTENALRKQLDYYPHYAYDRHISAFENPEEVNLGRQEFVNKHYSEIEDWINSGKHRLVKDFEFDKPLGMVIDRGESGFITADKIRVVLVRDGSVDGWHFLRSFLIS